MSLRMSLILAVLAGGACFTASAQTADEIITNYENAIGGKEKLATVKSLYEEGVAVMQNGTEINSKIWKVQDKLYRREISFGAGNIVILVTDKQGWNSNPQSGGSFQPMPDEAVKAVQQELDCVGPLVDYAAKGHKVELLGREDVNGVSCFKIKLTLKSGTDITYYINPTTWYIARQSLKGGGMMGGRRGGNGGGNTETKIDYSNYQKTAEGFVFPMTVAVVGMGASLNFEKIEVNKPVDAALYQPK
jgi:outer membrane lipoprotein-sorting protein